MEIIVYVDENGTEEGECDFRAIDICDEDENRLATIIRHSLADNNKFEKLRVLSEKEYQELINYRDSNPAYIEYKKAQEFIAKFNKKYDIHGLNVVCDKRKDGFK